MFLFIKFLSLFFIILIGGTLLYLFFGKVIPTLSSKK
jgi:hypothetical protein